MEGTSLLAGKAYLFIGTGRTLLFGDRDETYKILIGRDGQAAFQQGRIPVAPECIQEHLEVPIEPGAVLLLGQVELVQGQPQAKAELFRTWYPICGN